MKLAATLLAAAAWLGLPASPARAATSCGTIITNVAVATMTSGAPENILYVVSYNATVQITVLCPPVVKLFKWSSLAFDRQTIAPSGGTVTFQLCIQNEQFAADATVWNVIITDALPAGMAFTSTVAGFDLTSPSLGVPVPWFAPAPGGAWTTTPPAVGQGAPYYLRWIVPGIGPAKSACVGYMARVQ